VCNGDPVKRRSRTERWALSKPWKWSTIVGLSMFGFMALLIFGFGLGLPGSIEEHLVDCLMWGLAFFAINVARYCPTPQWMRRRRP
jgi:hypothetical protein